MSDAPKYDTSDNARLARLTAASTSGHPFLGPLAQRALRDYGRPSPAVAYRRGLVQQDAMGALLRVMGASA